MPHSYVTWRHCWERYLKAHATVTVRKDISYHGLILTVPNHAINSSRFTCNILQTWGKWIICLDIVLSTFVTYVGCCIILLLWTSILWITSWGCSLCAGGAVAGMWCDIGWCVAGRCCGIGAAALAKGWVGGGGGGGTGWEDAWEEIEGWKGCTGWGIT